MTDNEIIKALMCCIAIDCDCCPYCDINHCCAEMIESTLDLINRQKTEIERLYHLRAELSKENDVWKDVAKRETGYVELARTEAIKEFAERLENDLGDLFLVNNPCVPSIIDNLAKEMTEGARNHEQIQQNQGHDD